jgi:flagellar transcriptional activator FlhC
MNHLERHPQLRVDRQLRALNLAKACASLGARVRTIGHLTGLPPREVLRLLFPDRYNVPRGRPPDSPEWYHGTNLLNRVEASIVVVTYRRLKQGGFASADALVGAYRRYASLCESPLRISFDRAFDLVAHTDGIWLTSTQSFSIAACRTCRSEYLAPFGAQTRSGAECPFCKLVQRYSTDQRVQASFPVRPLPLIAGADLGLRRLLHGA